MQEGNDKTLKTPIGNNEPEPDFYSNSAKMVVSVYDISVTFGLKKEQEKDPSPLVTVRMSPHHAKVFSKLLAKKIEEYEENIGEIKLPQTLLDQFKIK